MSTSALPDERVRAPTAAAETTAYQDRARLRVCMLAETYHPVVGGCESQARLLADHLTKRGHEVLVITRRTASELPASDTLGKVNIIRVGPSGPGGFKRWPMIASSLRPLLRRRSEYDVLLVLGFRALGVAAAIVGLRGAPWVLKAESNGEMSGDFFAPRLARWKLGRESFPFRLLMRGRNAALARADAFVAISSTVADEFTAAGVPANRVERIPNAVDTELFRPVDDETKLRIRTRLGLDPRERIVAFTGRLVSYKGLPLLVRGWERIAADLPDVRLLLVGGGGQDIHNCERELREFVRDRNLDARVRFTGDVATVHEYLQASDFFAFPTENEAFGISLIEAMSCGLPVAACATGGVPDILTHDVDGLLVPTGDEAAFEQALRALLHDPQSAARLGYEARKVVEARYSVASVVDSYEQLLRRCLQP